MKYVDIDFAGVRVRARLLEERSPNASRALWEALPFEGRAVHGIWGGAMFNMLEPAPFQVDAADPGSGFQHPGLVVFEPSRREIAICYGHGRMNLSTGPLSPIPIAEIGGDLAPIAEKAHRLQFDGAQPISFHKSQDQSSALESGPDPVGRRVKVTFGETTATAILLEEQSPKATSAFAPLLPLEGIGTNTHSSGTLVRFWNKDGGPEGETPLEITDIEPGQAILYPGYLYYLPSRPWRGIRIPYEATAMGGATNRGTTKLVPIAKFQGDWSGFRETAERLAIEGARPLHFQMLDE